MIQKIWHYFNENDPDCWYKMFCFNKPIPITLCNRDPNDVKLYTENISQVTCKQCLHRINLIEINE